MKLGEILVQLGLVTPEQVRAALRMQELSGGKLGTHLVEAKLIGTDQLANALARQMGVQPALERHFSQADAAVINRITPALAARYMAIPLAISRTGPKRVIVAMTNPLDVTVVDELSFVLGSTVEPMVASEFVIANNLKRLYGIEGATKLRSTATHSAPARRFSHLDAPATPTPAPQPTPSPRPTTSTTPPPAPSLELEEAVRHMALAEHREQIADIFIDYMTGRFGCGLLFLVREGAARAWRGLAAGISQTAIETIVFPIAMPSCFQIAFERGAPFRGAPPLEGMSLQRKIWKYLRCGTPKDVTVIPVCVAGRVLVLVYAQSLDGGPLPEGPVGELQALCAAGGAALIRLIQKLRNDTAAIDGIGTRPSHTP
jgi:hypothetical protein